MPIETTANIPDRHTAVGEAARIDGFNAGELDKVRRDLADALVGVRLAWQLDNDDRAVQVCYGLEALLRAVSSLTNVVERLV